MSENSDDEVSQLLTSWGLSDLIAKFKANYIVLQALEFLSEQDIIDLIPKIGQRAIFRGRLQKWLKENADLKVPTTTPITTHTKAIASPIAIQNDQIKEEPGGDDKPKQHGEKPPKFISGPIPTVVIPAQLIESRPEKPKQGKTRVKSPVTAAPPIIRLVSPQALYQQAPAQTFGQRVRPGLEQMRHKRNGLGKYGTTAKPSAIQTKVQQFYIPPVQDETPSVREPFALTPDAYRKKPYKAPFVTSIIRVETNSDAKNSTKNKTFNTNVSRTTIMQKLNTTERPSTPPGTVSQFTDPVESTTPSPQPPQHSEKSPYDSLLYPLVKLETELVDMSSWKEFQDKKTEQDYEELLDMQHEETDVDSSDLQMDYLDSELTQDAESESETSTSLLVPMAQVDPPSPLQTRKRRGSKWSNKVLEKLDIHNILMDTQEGQSILAFYLANSFLDNGTRTKLIRVIADFCFRANLNIKPKDCREISCKILEVFPGEKLNDYFTGYLGKNLKSSLYTRYRALHKRFYIEMGLPQPNRRGRPINKTSL